MPPNVEVSEVNSKRDLKAYVTFPWKIYRGDRNWVPPLISDRLRYLSPEYRLAPNTERTLFLARRNGQVVGTIAAMADHNPSPVTDGTVGGFGFFETINDYDVASWMLDTVRAWARDKGMNRLRGPHDFTELDSPGVLVEGADCPPVMLAGHTPLYYRELLERYGLSKYYDLYAWRAFRRQIGAELEEVPEGILRAAQTAGERGVKVRRIRLDRWDEEIRIACDLFNATLAHLPEFIPISLEEFRRYAQQMKPILDPSLALFAEVDGRVVGFCVSLPDINRALIHINGRMYPFGWARLLYHIRRIEVVTFKLMGVLPEFRFRGIDAILFRESLKAFVANPRYQWLDGSLTSENNPMVNLIAGRFGAERYKHYRIYETSV
jgi:hypothetical protein